MLAADGISVDLIDMHTIKPLDEGALIESVSRTGCVVSAEEHQRFGGLGESVAGCWLHTIRPPSASWPWRTASANPEPRLSFSRSTVSGRSPLRRHAAK